VEIDLLEPRQLELGYRAFLKADRWEVWHGDRFVCSIPVTALERFGFRVGDSVVLTASPDRIVISKRKEGV